MAVDYQHGIYLTQGKSKGIIGAGISGMQVIIGTAPIHLLSNPSEAVNKPFLCKGIDDVIENLGYSENTSFTTNQSAFFTFEEYGVAPAVFINVLDPAVHFEEKTATIVTTLEGAVITDDGVLRDTLVLKSADGVKTFVENVDYIIALNAASQTVINVLRTSTILKIGDSVVATYNQLQPDAVTATEVIGGYNVATGEATGIELIRKIYPEFGCRPDILVAPGFSKDPLVAAVLQAKTSNINDSFNAETYLDLDTAAIKMVDDAKVWKNENGYNDKRAIGVWPCAKKNGKIYFYSAVLAAHASYLISQDVDGIPYQSPSNKKLGLDAIVLEDGQEIMLEIGEANKLNGLGVVTLLNWAGAIRSWGNNTLAYPESKNPEDRFISIRSVFDWWGNTFIETYFDRIDSNGDMRVVDTIIDEENARANNFVSSGKISGAKIEFLAEDNTTEDMRNGKFKFRQSIGAFGPFENLHNTIEYDASLTDASLAFGGEE